MVRMSDLLKRAKAQVGAKPQPPMAEKEEAPVSPTPERKPPLVEKEAQEPIAPPKERAPIPETPPIPAKEKPPVFEKEAIRPAVPEEKRPLEKEKQPSEEPVEFARFLGKRKEPSTEEVAQKFMKSYIPDEEETRRLYFETLEFVKKMFDIYKDGGKINKDDVINIAQQIVNNIILGSRGLLKLFHEIDDLKNSIYQNAINVSILSVNIGIIYKYDKSILLDLAIIGLLHDMDLIKSKQLIEKPERLSEKELKIIRRHPLNVATFADSAFHFKDEIVKTILQHHERRRGHGYPTGLTDGDIHELATIVGIADTYEAMTHSRPYKEKMSPHTALTSIINSAKELFPNEAVKALVSCVGLYPINTWVELNTGETCRVLMNNLDSPLRPIISIIMDKEGKKFKEARMIDLQKVPSLYVKQAVERKVDIEPSR